MEKSILVQKIEDMIGPGRQFSSTNELAQYLGLGSTKHTKFYDFLEGANTLSEKGTFVWRFQDMKFPYFMLRRGLHLEEKREDPEKGQE